MQPTLLENFSRALDPRLIVRAVVTVWDRYDQQKKKPGASRWENNTRTYRAAMVEDVLDEYCALSGWPPHEFPYHDDFIVRVWVDWRKCGDDKKRLTRELFELPTT